MDLKSRHGPVESRLVSRQVHGRLAERIMLAPFSVQLFLAYFWCGMASHPSAVFAI